MTSSVQGERAIPLCLPNNYQWDPETMKCTKTGEERSYIYVVKEALKKLGRIKGPVCVVSITGPYRKGKSYILSEAFHQPDVFPLGHTMLAETVGIWMWILPEKLKDCNGLEVSVVLLDTEGTDSAQGTGFDDHQIFTLTVLVSSVLIYNSSAVANRRDLEDLYFIVNLSEQIQVKSRSECDVGPKDSDIFHETFPYFVWLLRDVTLLLPSDCSNVKDYFLTKVFQEMATSEKSKKATRSILKFFSGFDAFALPLPTDKREVLHNISNRKDSLSPHFLKDLRQFQLFMKDVIVAKKGVKPEEPITGEGLAMLVELYVKAINTPGAVPILESDWDVCVKTRCSKAQTTAKDNYKVIMSSHLEGALPCDGDFILRSHSAALSLCKSCFMEETKGISTTTVQEYLIPLQGFIEETFNWWHGENARQTKEKCNALIEDLQKKCLDPIFQKLTEEEAHNLSFQDVVSAYDELKNEYKARAVGAKDIIAEVFSELHSKLKEKKKHNLALLDRVKRYSQAAVDERIARAIQDKLSKKLQEENKKLLQNNEDQRKQMEDLITKQRAEQKRFIAETEKKAKQNEKQMRDLIRANETKIKEQRKRLQAENEKLDIQNKKLKAENEQNLLTIKTYCDTMNNLGNNGLLDGTRSPTVPQEKSVIATQTENITSTPQGPLPNAKTSKFVTGQTKIAIERNAKLAKVQGDKEAIEKPDFIDRLLTTVSVGAPAIGLAVSAAAPPLAPIAATTGTVVGIAAAGLKKVKNNCNIM